LDVVTFYLDEPFDLLYYLRLRSTHAKFFFAQSEVALLAFHLNRKLLPPEGRDFEDVPESLAQLIDANYPVARGFVPKTDAADKLVNQWKNPEFNRLVTQVKEAENRGFTDALFFLFDLAGEGADTLIDIIVRTKASSKRKGRMHDASMLSSKDKRGITVASFPDGSEADMAMLKGLAMARKYKSKADEWLALGSIADSSNLVDGFGYSKELWESDSELDEHAKTFLKPGKALHADGRRIGRNERCPCRSVLKYKKCHGK